MRRRDALRAQEQQAYSVLQAQLPPPVPSHYPTYSSYAASASSPSRGSLSTGPAAMAQHALSPRYGSGTIPAAVAVASSESEDEVPLVPRRAGSAGPSAFLPQTAARDAYGRHIGGQVWM